MVYRTIVVDALEDDERRQDKGERERGRRGRMSGKKTRVRGGERDREREKEREREGTFFLVAAAEEENEGVEGAGGARGKENVVLCSSRCRSSSPGSFLRRGQRPTKPRSRLHSRSDCV